MVKAGGETLESVRRSLINPLDLSVHVEEEIERRIDLLVARDDLSEEEVRRLKGKMIALGSQKLNTPSFLDRVLHKYLEEQGVPTKDDYQKLLVQLEALTQKVEELNKDINAPDEL